jgi:hypothetical protein
VKIERIHEYVIPAVATLAGMILAVKLGSLTGRGSLGAMSLVLLAVLSITVCIWLRSKTWILIALTWDLTGSVPMTNLPLGVRDIVVLLVLGSYAVFYALKLVRVTAKLDMIDFLIGLILLYLLTVYIRNPVGTAAFGSQKVGGRPYFDAGIAFLAFAVLSRAPIDPQSIRRMPLYLLIATASTSLASLGIIAFPALGGALAQIYSGFAPPEVAIQTDATERKQGLSWGSNNGMRLLCSYFPPITLLFPIHFWRFCAASACMAGVLLSGFRSSFVTVVLYAILSSFFQRRIRDIVTVCLIGAMMVTFLALANRRVFTLPLAVQRVLTMFPGNWDPIAEANASDSTQWRLEMWRIVLNEDRYIQNRIFGDGYGFTRSELATMITEQLGGQGFYGAARQESFMISGMFHSGPLSTIRYVGYIGLFIYTSLIIIMAKRAWKLIRTAEGTPYFPAVLFVGMSIIISPLVFYLIAGAFQYNLPDTIFAAGLLKLLERGVNTDAVNDANSVIPTTRIMKPSSFVTVPRPHVRA